MPANAPSPHDLIPSQSRRIPPGPPRHPFAGVSSSHDDAQLAPTEGSAAMPPGGNSSELETLRARLAALEARFSNPRADPPPDSLELSRIPPAQHDHEQSYEVDDDFTAWEADYRDRPRRERRTDPPDFSLDHGGDPRHHRHQERGPPVFNRARGGDMHRRHGGSPTPVRRAEPSRRIYGAPRLHTHSSWDRPRGFGRGEDGDYRAPRPTTCWDSPLRRHNDYNTHRPDPPRGLKFEPPRFDGSEQPLGSHAWNIISIIC